MRQLDKTQFFWLITLAILASATALTVDESVYFISACKLSKILLICRENEKPRQLLVLDYRGYLFCLLGSSVYPVYFTIGCWIWNTLDEGNYGRGQTARISKLQDLRKQSSGHDLHALFRNEPG